MWELRCLASLCSLLFTLRCDIFSQDERLQALIVRGMRLPFSSVCRRPKMPFVGTDSSLEIS